MENPVINHHNLIDFPLGDRTLPCANGVSSLHGTDDIEMTPLQKNASYTSLKDLLLASPRSAASPTNNSWREIPIKDPLVQHAAWAYLQPMAEARDEDQRWWRRMEETCCRVFGCLNDVVLVVLKGWFAGPLGEGNRKVD